MDGHDIRLVKYTMHIYADNEPGFSAFYWTTCRRIILWYSYFQFCYGSPRRALWEPKFALSISVDLGKIGNPKFPKGPGYLLNHTPNNQNTKV